MTRVLTALLLVACSNRPAESGGAPDEPDAHESPQTDAAAPRVSHRQAWLAAAPATGLEVVWSGWVEPRVELGAASAEACLRIGVAHGAEPSAPRTLTLHVAPTTDAGARSTLVESTDRWSDLHCVHAGSRLSLVADEPAEVVVLSSAPLR